MEWVETTGRTVEEALDVALDELGVDELDVEYEVLVEPRGGLLGRLGSSEARIRARVKPLSREKPGDRRRGRRTPGEGPRGNGDVRGRRAARPAQETREVTTTVDDEHSEVPLDDQAELAAEFARGFVEAFGVEASVQGEVTDEDRVSIQIDGPDIGLLVGPRGATLAALEELTRAYVQRRTDGHGARIDVDVGGYRARRRRALAEFAVELADRVRESGREQALEPMSPADRKVVHDAIAPIDGVTTVSEGEEPRRRVVIRHA